MTTDTAYTLINKVDELVEMISPDSITSRTFYKDNTMKAILFAFDAGQELSEHTASQTAIVQIIKGNATVTLGDDQYELDQGAWLHMPPKLKHSVHANTQLLMLLTMLK